MKPTKAYFNRCKDCNGRNLFFRSRMPGTSPGSIGARCVNCGLFQQFPRAVHLDRPGDPVATVGDRVAELEKYIENGGAQ